MEPDISMWAEHNLDTHKPRVLGHLHDTARKIFGLGSYDLQAASTPIPATHAYKPGGTLSFVQGALRGRILERVSDPLGRWIYTKF